MKFGKFGSSEARNFTHFGPPWRVRLGLGMGAVVILFFYFTPIYLASLFYPTILFHPEGSSDHGRLLCVFPAVLPCGSVDYLLQSS